jgi:hypothetical protein
MVGPDRQRAGARGGGLSTSTLAVAGGIVLMVIVVVIQAIRETHPATLADRHMPHRADFFSREAHEGGYRRAGFGTGALTAVSDRFGSLGQMGDRYSPRQQATLVKQLSATKEELLEARHHSKGLTDELAAAHAREQQVADEAAGLRNKLAAAKPEEVEDVVEAEDEIAAEQERFYKKLGSELEERDNRRGLVPVHLNSIHISLSRQLG